MDVVVIASVLPLAGVMLRSDRVIESTRGRRMKGGRRRGVALLKVGMKPASEVSKGRCWWEMG